MPNNVGNPEKKLIRRTIRRLTTSGTVVDAAAVDAVRRGALDDGGAALAVVALAVVALVAFDTATFGVLACVETGSNGSFAVGLSLLLSGDGAPGDEDISKQLAIWMATGDMEATRDSLAP
jgi:hypothetical protein